MRMGRPRQLVARVGRGGHAQRQPMNRNPRDAASENGDPPGLRLGAGTGAALSRVNDAGCSPPLPTKRSRSRQDPPDLALLAVRLPPRLRSSSQDFDHLGRTVEVHVVLCPSPDRPDHEMNAAVPQRQHERDERTVQPCDIGLPK